MVIDRKSKNSLVVKLTKTKVLRCALASFFTTIFFGISYTFGPAITEWSRTISHDSIIFWIIMFSVCFIVSIVSVVLTEWIFDY